MVIVEVDAGEERGLGYSYADSSTATLIRDHLANIVVGRDAMSVRGTWDAMVHAIRNLGRPGISSMAISAVDTALWDLKARLLNLPLVRLFGQVRPALPIYGSGGFTSYSTEKLCSQLTGWIKRGITKVKMKIGRNATDDVQRVRSVREAVGSGPELFVDANGAYSCKQAIAQADTFTREGVTWFEEPVSSDDLAGLRFVREHAPSPIEIAAGEYGYEIDYFRRMLEHGAVDVLQADATRCSGFTGLLQVAALAEAHHLPLSSHCAPALHLHIDCAIPILRHAEYFHDHVRIEQMFFDGVVEPIHGTLRPELSRSGMGLELKRSDAEKFRV
jgi:L-alanine-DL-glutamate epimerase-like enolase superfamily enzyme